MEKNVLAYPDLVYEFIDETTGKENEPDYYGKTATTHITIPVLPELTKPNRVTVKL